MKVIQGISIIMGANIGTSITGWILCLSDIQGAGGIASLLSSTSIAAIMAILGLLVRSISKKDSYRAIGDILFGFTILMMGMSAMKTAMEPLQGIPQFTGLLTKFSIRRLVFSSVFSLPQSCRAHPHRLVSCSRSLCPVMCRFQQHCRSSWVLVSVLPARF